MNTISIQRLNSILNLADDLSTTVCWIRNANNTKQIYVSDHYAQIWDRPTSELYQNPDSFNQTVLSWDDSPRRKNTSGLNLYRIQKPDGSIAYIKDQHFLLVDNQIQKVGKMGFADEIPERLWFELVAGLDVEVKAEQTRRKAIEDIIKKEFNMNLMGVNSEPASSPVDDKNTIKLTATEQICLAYLLKGKVPKQIANEMKVSIKTIEFHLANIKRKYHCRHILQLLSKIHGYTE